MAVTEEEVVWCYRSFLGRSPESARVVKEKTSGAKDFRSLVLGFINSQEYKNTRSTPTSFVSLDKGEMHVQTTASATELSLLRHRIREAWTHLGTVRPQQSGSAAQDHLPEWVGERSSARYYATGAADVASIGAVLRRHGFRHPESKTCVEYGCGLGRMTLPLAKVFKKVHGYDISASHLEFIKKQAADAGITNVDFHQCSADVSSEILKACDFFYSRVVFQHNPPPLIRELISASLKSLRPGAIGIFQVPTYMMGYSFRIKEYLASPRKLDMEMHCIPQPEVFSLIAAGHCKLLEVREDGWIGRYGEWISNTFVVQRLDRAQRH